jgi:hypothetical protein
MRDLAGPWLLLVARFQHVSLFSLIPLVTPTLPPPPIGVTGS